MTEPLEYYASNGAALFPIPVGKKAPVGIVKHFKEEASTDPAQWAKWRQEYPGCNFGVVAFRSNWITLDTDIKPRQDQSADDARNEAWALRGELLTSWGMDANTPPHTQSAHGGWHDHFVLPAGVDASTLRQPDAIKGRIDVRVKGYTIAAGGYYDGTEKNDAPGHYQLFGDAAAPHPAPAALIEHCRPAKARESVAKLGTHDQSDVGGLVKWLDQRGGFEAYEDWTALGMALKLECGDDAKDLWALSHNDTVTDDVIESKWDSFASEATSNSVTLASFMKRAHDMGWKGSIRPSVGSMFGAVLQLAPGSAPSIAPGAAPSVSKHLKRSGDFVRGFVPPDYLVDGILQRRFCYSLTAQTGVGKTTIAMLLAAHVATGKPLGNLDVEKGTVLYFAGENPTDVQMRWLGLCRDMGLDPETVDVIFVEGTKRFSETAAEITQELIDAGATLSLVVVDTVAAFFEGDNDNDNVQMGNHARMLRSLTLLPGGPCVVVLAHPTKNATDDNLVPRGGGAFLNEVDGNIALGRNESTVTAAALGKFRGPEFSPINFELKVIGDHPTLKDSKGRQIPTIVARPISSAEQARKQEKSNRDEDKVLELLCNDQGLGPAKIAESMGWGKDHKKASRALAKLAGEKLVKCVRGCWIATPDGQKAANMVAQVAAAPVQALKPLTPAVLGGAAFPTPLRPGAMPPMPPPPG